MSELIDIAGRLNTSADKLDALAHIRFEEPLNGAAVDGLSALLVDLANEVREAHNELCEINVAQRMAMEGKS